jgi:hypothetical protein
MKAREHASHRRPVRRGAELEVLEGQRGSREGENARGAGAGGGERRQAFDFRGERFGAAGLDEVPRG